MPGNPAFVRWATALAVGILAVAGCSAGGSATTTGDASPETGAATTETGATETSSTTTTSATTTETTPTETTPVLPRPAARLPRSTGRTFYVAPNGRDGNPGTLQRPWRTIRRAASRLGPGQRALVRGGTYRENVEINRSGTARRPITIAAFPGARPVIESAEYPLEIEGSYVRIRGFVLQGARGTSSTNVYFESGADHVELVRNEVRFSQDQGVFSEEETSHLLILANRIHHNGINHRPGQHQSHGIYLQGRGHLVANNAIHDHREGFGIQVYDQNRGSVIVNNTVVTSGHAGIVVGGSGGVADITIHNNILAYNATYGVQMDSDCPTGRVSVDANVIFGNGDGAVEGGCSRVAVGRNFRANPRFVSLARRNLVPGARSPAVNHARADSAPRYDIRGARRPRGGGYDIGAYER
jgi:Right handed beta helix region